MPPAGLDALQIGLVLIGSLLGNRTQSSRWVRYAFFTLLAVGSIYIGYTGINMLSPNMAKTPSFSLSNRHALAITYCSAAVASGILLMPGARRLFVRLSGWRMDTPERIFGAWLFAVMFLINACMILQFSPYFITIFTIGLDSSYRVINTVVQPLSYTLIALIGAGIYFRRSPGETWQRLGLLRRETQEGETADENAELVHDLAERAGAVLLMVGGSLALGTLGVLVVKRYVYGLYAPLLFSLGNMLPAPHGGVLAIVAMAIGIGFLVGVGEELLFRGLLQPSFGLIPTALLFTVLHGQYGLSPALGFVFLQGLGYGWLRKRYNTWVSLIAHVMYTTVAIIVWWTILR
ncbi:MAG: CPBP family intramembrane metalloprotease [Ktedonobacteraceae bacterium]|nr:CPBP family intramembrane metalloprotease [Ktedonobacteraceae bacterium]